MLKLKVKQPEQSFSFYIIKKQEVNSSNESRINYILGQISDSKVTVAELEELMQLLKEDSDPATLEFVRNYYNSREREPINVSAGDEQWQDLFNKIVSTDKPSEQEIQIPEISRTGGFIGRWWWAAATAATIIGVAAYFATIRNDSETQARSVASVSGDVTAPAISRATITLDNGKQIYLDSANNGTLTAVGNVQIVKLADGQIAYKGGTDQTIYNTLSNPRGSRVVDITLSDGSRVWLNAGSSVSYPVAFTGSERKVTVNGEAYFDVAHDASKPFIVSKGLMEVQVLGTEFNINAYDDEPEIKITLIKGSVNVKAGDQGKKQQVLKPGQQSVLNKEGDLKLAAHPDIEETIAWKNDKFIFTGNDISSVMRQLEKWYDVDVEYQGNKTNEEFVGVVPRRANVSEVLSILESTHAVSFEVIGKKIIVK